MQDLARLLAGPGVHPAALPRGEHPQRAERQLGAEGQHQLRRPQRVAAEEGEEPGRPGRHEGVAGRVGRRHPQPVQVGQRAAHQGGQVPVHTVHPRPRPLGRPGGGDQHGGPRVGGRRRDVGGDGEGRPSRCSRTGSPAASAGRRPPRPRPPRPAAGRATPRRRRAGPRQRTVPAPATGGAGRIARPCLIAVIGARSQPSRSASGRRDRAPGVVDHPDGLVDRADLDPATALHPDRRVGLRVAEPRQHRDEGDLGRAVQGVSDRLRLPAVDGQHQLGEHPDVGVQHPGGAARTDLAVRSGQRGGRGGQAADQPVQERLPAGPTLRLTHPALRPRSCRDPSLTASP